LLIAENNKNVRCEKKSSLRNNTRNLQKEYEIYVIYLPLPYASTNLTSSKGLSQSDVRHPQHNKYTPFVTICQTFKCNYAKRA